jgi:hypothetical protein
MENYIPDNDTIEELIGEELTDEKKRELNEMKLIDRYNQYYNDECSAMPHGMPISMEHLQATTIRAVLYAFARKYNMKKSIPVEDLKNLADLIEKQGNEYLKKVKEFNDSADGVA